ncbi:hypothetical protein PJI17_29995 [Mycobacterium kansasii]
MTALRVHAGRGLPTIGRPDGTLGAISAQSAPSAHSRRRQRTVDAASAQSTPPAVDPTAPAHDLHLFTPGCGARIARSDNGCAAERGGCRSKPGTLGESARTGGSGGTCGSYVGGTWKPRRCSRLQPQLRTCRQRVKIQIRP